MRTLIFIIIFWGTAKNIFAQVVSLRDETKNGEFVLWIKNNLPCPSLVYTESDSTHQKYEQFLPQHSERILVRLPADSIQSAKKFRGGLKYHLILGNPYAIPDPQYRYLLPYPQGKFYRLVQGNDTDFTHNTPTSKYAFDFEMPEGSLVTAARGGVVGFVEERNNQGGITEDFMDKVNQIMVCHDDGTVAIYAHLKENGALVKVGDQVFAGQVIGFSGNTGFSTGPHLHFVVVVADTSIPIQFMNLPEHLEPHRYYQQDLKY